MGLVLGIFFLTPSNSSHVHSLHPLLLAATAPTAALLRPALPLLPSSSSSVLASQAPTFVPAPGLLRAAAPYPTSRSAFALPRPRSSVLLRRPRRPACCGAAPRLDGARETARRPRHHVRGGLAPDFHLFLVLGLRDHGGRSWWPCSWKEVAELCSPGLGSNTRGERGQQD